MSPLTGKPPPDEREVLVHSKDGRSVKRAAVALARSPEGSDHQFLAEHLAATDLVHRMDPPETIAGSYQHLRLARVIRTLWENPRPSAQEALLTLVGTIPFNDHYLRIQILIRALASVRPSPPAAVRYWDRYSSPGSPVTYDVMEALCLNQSAPALDLLEARFAHPAFGGDEKRVWMRESILVRRYDDPLIERCERILLGPMDPDQKISLVEVLFDYRPDEWFIECAPPRPAELATMSRPAQVVLRRIAEYALGTLDLPERIAVRVRSTLETLEASG